MASAYLEVQENVESPRVALINIGSEESKGNELMRSAYPLLKGHIDNFVGNIESRYFLNSDVDVIVCDGFTGNIVLKLIEGIINNMIIRTMKSVNSHSMSKLVKPVLYPVFKDIKKFMIESLGFGDLILKTTEKLSMFPNMV